MIYRIIVVLMLFGALQAQPAQTQATKPISTDSLYSSSLQLQFSISNTLGREQAERKLSLASKLIGVDPDSALALLKQVQISANQVNDRLIERSSLKIIAQAYSKKGNYQKALAQQQCAAAIADTLMLGQQRLLIDLQNHLELDQQASERQSLYSNIQLVALLFVLMIAALHFFLWRSTQREVEIRRVNQKKIALLNRNLELKVKQELEKHKQQHALLVQKSKMEALGKMAAGLAHELNQPLTGISLGVDNILSHLELDGKVAPDYLNSKLDSFLKNIERARNLVEHIRVFSRDQSTGEVKRFDAWSVVADAISLTGHQLEQQHINLVADVPVTPCPICGNPYRLEQVLLNLIANARDAVSEKLEPDYMPLIRISCLRLDTKVILKIEDNGVGIPVDDIPRIVEPFYTTKQPNVGTGLGLSITYGIVQEFGGSIEFDSKPGSHTLVTVELPVAGDNCE